MSVGSLHLRSPVRWTPRCCHWYPRRKQATCSSARQRDDSRCLREIQVAWPYLHQCRLEICLHRMQSRWLSHQERGTDNRGSEGFLSVPEEDSSIWRLMRRPTVKTWFCAWIAFLCPSWILTTHSPFRLFVFYPIRANWGRGEMGLKASCLHLSTIWRLLFPPIDSFAQRRGIKSIYHLPGNL